MPATHPLTGLADRKRLLALQVDLHRTLLRAECINVRTRLSWLNKARHKVRSAGPWLAVGAAALGAWQTWRELKLD